MQTDAISNGTAVRRSETGFEDKAPTLYRTIRAPFTVQLELSARCPNECFHCYNFWRNDKDGRYLANAEMTIQDTDAVMMDLITHNVFHVVLTGGEPLLNKQAVFLVLERAMGADITVSLNSTLISLTRRDALRMQQLKLLSVLTSILGPTASVHNAITQRAGSFTKTVRGIHILQDLGIPVSVNMVITQMNKHFVKETAHFVRSLGVKSFFATRAGCPGNCGDFSPFALDLAEFRTYLDELYTAGQEEGLTVGALESYPLCGVKEVRRYKDTVGRKCLAGVMSCTIGVDGEVRPCSHLDVQYGNILKEGLPSIWSKMSDWREGKYLPQVCRSCNLLTSCGGGCRMEAKMRNGELTAIDPYAAPPDVAYVAEELAAQARDKKPVALPASLRVNPEIRWREEEFGVAVFIKSQFKAFINKSAFLLLESLNKENVFEIAKFQRTTEDIKFLKLMGELYRLRILIKKTV